MGANWKRGVKVGNLRYPNPDLERPLKVPKLDLKIFDEFFVAKIHFYFIGKVFESGTKNHVYYLLFNSWSKSH